MITLLLALAPVTYCTAEQRIKETGLPLACGSELGEPHRIAGGWLVHCTMAVTRECATRTGEDAYCIWRADGTVEAKNATCTSDGRGSKN